MIGPLTRTPLPPDDAPVGEGGWFELSDGDVVESLCGPGWSYSEPETGGTWTEGGEARMTLPRPGPEPLVAELELVVLGNDDSRWVHVRVDGRPGPTVTTSAERERTRVEAAVAPGPTEVPIELSLLVGSPTRPVDVGLGPDVRRLGALVQRVRVRAAQ